MQRKNRHEVTVSDIDHRCKEKLTDKKYNSKKVAEFI